MAKGKTSEVKKEVNKIIQIKAQEAGINLDILINKDSDMDLVKTILDRFTENDNYSIIEQRIYANLDVFLKSL